MRKHPKLYSTAALATIGLLAAVGGTWRLT